ncbi:MAG: imidazoleglycerol-phosphate dehydratase [Rhodobacterales bacterium]|nr:MAG: imidazoleglycerol-phosphate dehydratase [Rhodobacterales bacterium]
MKKIISLTVAGLFLAGAAAADPVLGTWKTQTDDGAYAHVKMTKCGSNVCGTIVKTFNFGGEYNSKNKGKQLVRNMKPGGDGSYSGKVWRPSNGKVYIGKMQLSGNKLKLKGCVAGGLLCSSQTWSRIN